MAEADSWPAMPTETEIYLLPDGRVVIADLPVELSGLAAELGAVDGCSFAPTPDAELSNDGID